MPTRNVVLTQRQSDLIDRLVENGTYQNASEVLRDGLRLVEERGAEAEAKLAALRAAAAEGVADVASGRFTTFETDEDIKDHFDTLARKILRR
jgi:antitoxin ParD1/3/4